MAVGRWFYFTVHPAGGPGGGWLTTNSIDNQGGHFIQWGNGSNSGSNNGHSADINDSAGGESDANLPIRMWFYGQTFTYAGGWSPASTQLICTAEYASPSCGRVAEFDTMVGGVKVGQLAIRHGYGLPSPSASFAGDAWRDLGYVQGGCPAHIHVDWHATQVPDTTPYSEDAFDSGSHNFIGSLTPSGWYYTNTAGVIGAQV